MIDMKISDEEKKEMSQVSILDKPSYPYGLKLRIESEQLEKFGIKEIPKVGQKFTIIANAFVENVGMEDGEEDEVCVGLQIKEMDMKVAKEQTDHVKMIYGESES